jgi:hypothetical protein
MLAMLLGAAPPAPLKLLRVACTLFLVPAFLGTRHHVLRLERTLSAAQFAIVARHPLHHIQDPLFDFYFRSWRCDALRLGALDCLLGRYLRNASWSQVMKRKAVNSLTRRSSG